MLIYPNLFMSTLLWEEIRTCSSNLNCFSNVQNVITNLGVNILKLKSTKSGSNIYVNYSAPNTISNLQKIWITLRGTSVQEMCPAILQIIWNSNLPNFLLKSPPPRPTLPKIHQSWGYTATILNFKYANIRNLENSKQCYLTNLVLGDNSLMLGDNSPKLA